MANRGTITPVQQEALDYIWTLLVGGTLITVAGASLANAAWPHEEVVMDGPSPQHSGDAALAHFFLAAAGIGAVILFAGVLAVAVKLGVEAARIPVPEAQVMAHQEE